MTEAEMAEAMEEMMEEARKKIRRSQLGAIKEELISLFKRADRVACPTKAEDETVKKVMDGITIALSAIVKEEDRG